MNNISARKYGFIVFFDTFSGCYFRACRWVTIQCETFCAKTVVRRKSKCCSKAVLSAFLFLIFQGHMVSGEDILKTLLSTNILGDFHTQFRVSTVFGITSWKLQKLSL